MHDSSGRWSVSISLLIIGCISWVLPMSSVVYARSMEVGNQDFSINMLGGRDHGTDGIRVSVPSGKVRISISEAFSPFVDKFRGVGIVETTLNLDDSDQAKEIFDRLCDAANRPPLNESPASQTHRYSVRCLTDGKMFRHNGALSELPRGLYDECFSFYKKVFKKYPDEGRALVRIEAEVADVRPDKDKFLVAVKFINSGKYPVSIRTPDEWKKPFDRLNIAGWNESRTEQWNADLAGAPLINKSELSTWILDVSNDKSPTLVTVPAGGSVVFKMTALPDGKVPRGSYKFGAIVYANMITGDQTGAEIEDSSLNIGSVRFSSSAGRSFILDRDYPSTPDEWRNYEVRQREKLSENVVRPGDQFPEDGYYRLVSDSGQRSRFVTKFKRGKTAEIEKDLRDDSDRIFTGHVAWQWEADSALATSCDPDQPCPRDGHWVAVTRDYGWLDKRYTLYADTKRYFRAGEFMQRKKNSYGEDLRYQAWYWLGV